MSPTDQDILAQPCSIAFKEWAGVCRAIGSGRQSLILRKGGVSEGPGGFRPDHPAFWLYPTYVHEAEQGLRTPDQPPPVEAPGVVEVDTLAVVEGVWRVERLDQLGPLSRFHDWTDSTVLTRFRYRTLGLWALAVRAYRAPSARPVPITEAHLGCKTWVPLEAPLPTTDLTPVLGDLEASVRLQGLMAAIDQEGGPRVAG